MGQKFNVEVCFTPATYQNYRNDNAIVVVVDVLRATSSIVTAFMNGVNKIIPVGTLEEAKAFKEKGYMVAAERDGIVRDFADFGNSPDNFSTNRVKGRDIVYSTTNGTNSIMMAKDSYRVLIGTYLNHKALVDFITTEKKDLLVLCAGWKNKFNLEDSLFAGALCEAVLQNENFQTICDATIGAIDLWGVAKPNLMEYVDKAAQRTRLKNNKLDDCIAYCHDFNRTALIPVLKDDYLIEISNF